MAGHCWLISHTLLEMQSFCQQVGVKPRLRPPCGVLILVLLAMVGKVSAGCSDDGICYVDSSKSGTTCASGQECATIQEALDAAGSQSTITVNVAPGTYTAATYTLLNKTYTIQGNTNARDTTVLKHVDFNATTKTCTTSGNLTSGKCKIFDCIGGVELNLKYLTLQDAEQGVQMAKKSQLIAQYVTVPSQR